MSSYIFKSVISYFYASAIVWHSIKFLVHVFFSKRTLQAFTSIDVTMVKSEDSLSFCPYKCPLPFYLASQMILILPLKIRNFTRLCPGVDIPFLPQFWCVFSIYKFRSAFISGKFSSIISKYSTCSIMYYLLLYNRLPYHTFSSLK